MGPENNCLRFWDILGGQVQNGLKTLGNRFLGSDLTFWKNVKNGRGNLLVTLLGQVQNDLKTLGERFCGRDLNFKKIAKMGAETIWLRFWDILGSQVQNGLKTLGN